ncbi:MAG: hypothetical protein JW869_05785 [Candidatus Omnitrophica bacterium]|nr:hypothetical protein [Candidatus Omnitrophota bacterium]
MAKISMNRITATLFFLALLSGAVFCVERIAEDIATGRYFANVQEIRYDIGFLASYTLIILFVLRYGYFLAVNRVNWSNVKDDFIYLLNRKYFNRTQWVINILLFWLALIGFIYSLAISAMKGNF